MPFPSETQEKKLFLLYNFFNKKISAGTHFYSPHSETLADKICQAMHTTSKFRRQAILDRVKKWKGKKEMDVERTTDELELAIIQLRKNAEAIAEKDDYTAANILEISQGIEKIRVEMLKSLYN